MERSRRRQLKKEERERVRVSVKGTADKKIQTRKRITQNTVDTKRKALIN